MSEEEKTIKKTSKKFINFNQRIYSKRPYSLSRKLMDKKKLNTIRTRPRFKLETDLSKEDFELNLKNRTSKKY